MNLGRWLLLLPQSVLCLHLCHLHGTEKKQNKKMKRLQSWQLRTRTLSLLLLPSLLLSFLPPFFPCRRKGISCSSTLPSAGTIAPSGLATASPAPGASRQPSGWVLSVLAAAASPARCTEWRKNERKIFQGRKRSWFFFLGSLLMDRQTVGVPSQCFRLAGVMPPHVNY